MPAALTVPFGSFLVSKSNTVDADARSSRTIGPTDQMKDTRKQDEAALCILGGAYKTGLWL